MGFSELFRHGLAVAFSFMLLEDYFVTPHFEMSS
jgi:hypothetical protein